MASKSLGTLTIDLIAKIGGFTSGLDKAGREADKKSREMVGRLDGMKKAAAAWGVAFAAALSAVAVGLAYNTKQAIDNADALDEMSQRTGLAVETLSRLQIAAEFGAVSMEDLQKAVGRLAVQQQNYAEGNADTVALFDALGVKVIDTAGKLRDAEAVLVDLADVFAGMPDGAQKTALAIDLLGKSGQNLIPFLNQGSEKLAEINQIADDLGLTISTETAQAAGEFNDQLFVVSKTMDGLYTQLAAELLPELVNLVSAFTDLIREGGGVKGVAEDIADGLRGVVNIARAASIQFEAMGERLDILRALGNSLVDPENWRAYNAEVQQSLNRLEGLAGANARLAQQTRELFGIDAPTPQPGGSSGSPNGRGRGVQVDIRAQNVDLDAYTERRERAAAASRAQAEADRAAAEAARELERADAELARRLEEMARLQADFVGSLDSLEAQLAGPLAEAELAHKQRIAELQKLLDEGIITIDEATRAQMLYAESFKRTKDELDPLGEGYRQLLSDMQFEYDLLGRTNAERITELELRRLGIDLSSQEAAAARETIQARVESYEALQQTISAMDQFRSSFEDNVAGVLDGSKSIKDALRDMVNDFIAQLARLAAQRFTESLFGQYGTSQTGSAGGWLSSLFGAFFGGPKAAGGPVMAGVPYLVGEQGPELVIPKAAGTVVPAGQTAAMLGRGATIVQNFNMPGRYDLRTQAQVAADAGRGSQRALARGTA